MTSRGTAVACVAVINPWEVSEAEILLPSRYAEQNICRTSATGHEPNYVKGLAASALNMPEVKQKLGISPERIAVAPIIVGEPRGEVSPSSRHEVQITV